MLYQYLSAAVISFLSGWLCIHALTVHPSRLLFYSTMFGITISANLVLIILSVFTGSLFLTLALILILFVAGYLVHAYSYLSKKGNQSLTPAIVLNEKIQGEKHRAIIYFTHGEPETYNPVCWLDQFREFDSQGIRFIPFVARPIFIYLLRKKYLTVGKSNHRQVHMGMLNSLERAYRQEGDTNTRFYISFLDDEPKLDTAIIDAVNDGADHIIVSTVFLTESNHTAEGRRRAESIGIEKKHGVRIIFTDPLWDSKLLMQAFVEKVMSNIGSTPKEKVGIALVGHGQPEKWDREFPTMTTQQNSFRHKIIELLEKEGFLIENMGNAWMEFKNPKPYSLMERFVKNGVQKIFYFAASISADAIHSQSDIPELVNKYPFPSNIEVINLGAWNGHPLVINAIKEKIDQQSVSV